MQLYSEQTSHYKIAPELAGLEVSKNSDEDKKATAADVIHRRSLGAREDEVADLFAVPPLQNVWAKAVVGKALGWVYERVPSKFEMDVDGLDSGLIGPGSFIRMVLNGSAR